MDATSVPSRAILASRFFATLTVAPLAFISRRSFWNWATVKPASWSTTTTEVFANTPFSDATASDFAVLSTGLSPVGGLRECEPPVALAARTTLRLTPQQDESDAQCPVPFPGLAAASGRDGSNLPRDREQSRTSSCTVYAGL